MPHSVISLPPSYRHTRLTVAVSYTHLDVYKRQGLVVARAMQPEKKMQPAPFFPLRTGSSQRCSIAQMCIRDSYYREARVTVAWRQTDY